jgi:hypothetical protein
MTISLFLESHNLILATAVFRFSELHASPLSPFTARRAESADLDPTSRLIESYGVEKVSSLPRPDEERMRNQLNYTNS